MAATHADRAALGENAAFIARVQGALEKYANVVGGEVIPAGQNARKYERRTNLINDVLVDPARVAARFARAAAGSTLADAVYQTAGTANLNNVTDAAIDTYVAAAWDVIAGVQPTER